MCHTSTSTLLVCGCTRHIDIAPQDFSCWLTSPTTRLQKLRKMSSALHIRRATLADRQAVLAISNDISDGMDYLPTLYTVLLQDPTFKAYVAEMDDQIVSFSGRFLDKENGFYTMVASRTMERYKGQGIMGTLLGYIVAQVEKDYGGKCESLSVSSEKPKIHTLTYWYNPELSLVLRHVYLVYVVPYEAVLRGVTVGRADSRVQLTLVENLNLEQAQEVLTDPYTRNQLITTSHLMAFSNCLPVANSTKSLRRIAAQCKVYATFKENSPKALCVSYSSLMCGPVFVNFDVYFCVREHPDVVLAHITHQLEHLAAVITPAHKVALRLYFPTEVDKKVVKEFLRPVFGKTRISKVHPLESAIIESKGGPHCRVHSQL